MNLWGMPNLLRDYVRCARYTSNPQLRVHGNGFIQLDVDDKTRLHFWGDARIPHQKVDTGWHDHNFSVYSSVLMGKLNHVVYSVSSDDEHGLFHAYQAQARPGTQDTKLVRLGTERNRFMLHIDQSFQIKEGESYGFFHSKVHYSQASVPTITLMKKVYTLFNPEMMRPTVYCPVGLTPDNEFDRDGFSQASLWEIVEDMVNA